MKIETTPLAGLLKVRLSPRGDVRGRFTRLFCETDFAGIRPDLKFTQINLSETKARGTVRGLHYQMPPTAEAKFIHCLHGKIFDVAVDLRAGSPTFRKWFAIELTEKEKIAIFIPEGFAHGFQALSDDVQMLYMHTAPWSPASEGGIRPDDPALAIEWPLAITTISERDRSHPLLPLDYAGMQL